MVAFTHHLLALALLAASSTFAIPSPLTPDPAGAKNIGNAAGGQFIGGACLSSKDCASACCATLSGAGICSGVGAQFQAGKTGCGFGDGGAVAQPPPAASNPATQPPAAGSPDKVAPPPSPSPPAAVTPPATGGSGGRTVNTNAPGSENVGKGNGAQFITGQCFSDADCASGCCAGPKGACSARAVAEENGKSGCGFVAA